ncbi:MAG: STAS domain-containing protein [Chitinivibrionales bacterium]|nr:STAS domain-containing protein [Chitinivibrionales bacterium]MBD3357230.1 STAS domain-containing protein [Chitinivibrionales bacterium]
MFSVEESESRQYYRLSSHIHLVDRVIDTCRPFVNARDPEPSATPLCQVLRELLLNAIEHGNKGDAQKSVECELERIGDARYRIVIGDRGEGVDEERLSFELSDDVRQERSRGYAIVNAIADQLEFEPEKARITAYVSLPRETTFECEETSDCRIVTPGGDITATVAEQFRSMLLGWADGGAKMLCLNMEKVGNVDSVCLSVLVSFSNTLETLDGGKRFEIVNVQPDLMKLFELTRLVKIFTVRGRDARNG